MIVSKSIAILQLVSLLYILPEYLLRPNWSQILSILGGPVSDDLWELSAAMQEAWLSFARHGDPGWQAWNSESRPTQRFDVVRELLSDPMSAERGVWEGVL